MPIYIANAEADQLARDLAAATGETLTEAVTTALRERLDRTKQLSPDERYARIMAIATTASALLRDRPVSDDDLYDENGLPR
jgi:antitoxin VapB